MTTSFRVASATSKISEKLPALKERGIPWHEVFRFQPTTLFVPTVLEDGDWQCLLALLVGEVIPDWDTREKKEPAQGA